MTCHSVLAGQHRLAVRVEAKADGPEALDAALKLVEIDAPTSVPDRRRARRGAKLWRESERREGGHGRHAARRLAAHARPRLRGRGRRGAEGSGRPGSLGLRRRTRHPARRRACALSRAAGGESAREAGRHHSRRGRRGRRSLHHRL